MWRHSYTWTNGKINYLLYNAFAITLMIDQQEFAFVAVVVVVYSRGNSTFDT